MGAMLCSAPACPGLDVRAVWGSEKARLGLSSAAVTKELLHSRTDQAGWRPGVQMRCQQG